MARFHEDGWDYGGNVHCSYACKFSNALNFYRSSLIEGARTRSQESRTSLHERVGTNHQFSSDQYLMHFSFLLRPFSCSASALKMGWSDGMLWRDTMLTTTCCAIGMDQNPL